MSAGTRGAWVLAGLAAGLAGTGAAELAAAVVAPSSSPVVAASRAFIDLTPPALKDFAISAFGTRDKQVLLVGAVVVLAGLSALAGLLARRHPQAAVPLVLGLGAVGALAAVTRPDATAFAVVPSVAGAIVGAVALTVLRNRYRAAAGAVGGDDAAGSVAGGGAGVVGGDDAAVGDGAAGAGRGDGAADAGRRALLAGSVVTAGGGLVVAGAGRWLGDGARGVADSRAAVRLPAPASRAPALPGDVEVGVAGVVPFRVPNDDFYRIDTAAVVPRVRAQDWRLHIHGLVAREITLDYPGLLAGQLVERDLTLMCVSNEVGGDLTGNARWLGLPLAGLLRQAGPSPDADMVLSTSADGWTAGTPLDVLVDGRDALLAVGMNGEPLPVEHGFPVRMVVPGLYGYVSATKWVVDLEVTRFDRAEGYWTPRGWSARGPVKTSSRIDVPRDRARPRAGTVAVAGVAWAQHRGIRGVEVQVDDGPWQTAELGAAVSADTWRQWVYRWQAAPGRHRLAVRATDGNGQVQTGATAPPAPDGATGWHTIEVTVV